MVKQTHHGKPTLAPSMLVLSGYINTFDLDISGTGGYTLHGLNSLVLRKLVDLKTAKYFVPLI